MCRGRDIHGTTWTVMAIITFPLSIPFGSPNTHPNVVHLGPLQLLKVDEFFLISCCEIILCVHLPHLLVPVTAFENTLWIKKY